MAELTRHAEVRMQQRGIMMATLQSLLEHGAKTHDHRGAAIVYFDKKAKSHIRKTSGRQAYQSLDKQLDAYAIVTAQGRRTVGHRHKRIRRIWLTLAGFARTE
jgi:hypothetical protein